MTARRDIRSLSEEQLRELLGQWGEPTYRARQIHEWIWQKAASSFDEMTNIPLSLREKLSDSYEFRTVKLDIIQKSNDGTIKCAFRLHDDNVVEGVLIPSGKRMTACISSQVGCSLDCKFCATGYLKRVRNLNPDEFYDQVVRINELAEENYGRKLTNIVLMGMGEPLLNYANVMKGIERITSPDGLGMSPQRITLSTAGIAKMIRKLGDDGVRFHLALSLHAANNAKRSAIMPINETNSLEDLAEALNYFYEKTRSRITLEYCVINDINDHPEEAEELLAFARKVPCKINLIEYNPIDMAEFRGSSLEKLTRFKDYLERHKLIVNLRRSRGKDIDAACGQLANKH
jgi:23S rRNA (adenine2503-C2)-methyltransferase